jgi:hypothetical protein
MQLCFRHRSLASEQKPIIKVGRIKDPINVGNQRVEQGTDFKKLMPVATRRKSQKTGFRIAGRQ